jgi:hypothetical protein
MLILQTWCLSQWHNVYNDFFLISVYCGGTRTASETPQTLSSPGYPSPVYQPIQCRWTIDTPEQNQQVLLTMTNLDLRVQNGCMDEYVEFRDTPMVTINPSYKSNGNN